MGNRDYKESGENAYFHVYNRGNSKNDIFLSDEDYRLFILRLNQNLFPDLYKPKRIFSDPLPEGSFSLISYCLMPNHFHLLIRQNKSLPISRLILKVCTSYSKYFNRKYDRVGHVFQDQYKQVLVDHNDYLKWLSAYIHQNPVTAGIVKNPDDYRWSSAGDYIGQGNHLMQCDKAVVLDQFGGSIDYLSFMKESGEIIKRKKDLGNLFLD